jgi:hypothetical protein
MTLRRGYTPARCLTEPLSFDIHYTTDTYDAQFTGTEDTLNRTAWAYSRGLG